MSDPDSNRAREAPWQAGLRAAKANVVPGLIVQGMMLSLLVAYFFHPPTQAALGRLAILKEQWGYVYSAVAAIIAGALIPEILRICVFQRLRAHRRNFSNIAFASLFWCVMGVMVDGFYRLQAHWFGSEATFSVVAIKVLVDQFIYTPFIAAPITAVTYELKNRGFSTKVLVSCLTPDFLRHALIPTVFAGWGVWIPLVVILYSLPSNLQIPMFGFALSLWVILFTWMSEKRAGLPD